MSVSSDGFPIDRIDGKDALLVDGMRTTFVPTGAVFRKADDEVAFNRTCDHQMVEMGAIVTARNRAVCVNERGARLSADPLPYHEKQSDGQND